MQTRHGNGHYLPFDQNGNLTLLDYQLGGSTLRSYGYTYDANGMRESMTTTGGPYAGLHSYTYDSLYQITEATHPTSPTEQFAYDAVGNRIPDFGKFYDHNELNQLLEDDSCRYSYDADGNMTQKVNKNTLDTTVYVWDIENRLTSVQLPDGGFVEYVYGPLGRRLAKVVNGVRSEYRYDGEDLILEMDENDSITASYTFGPGIDNPLSMTRSDTTLYYVKDGLGSVTALTDSVGDVVQEYNYSVFGEIIDQTGIGVLNPFLYTSREWEPEVGLYYYRARFYDPVAGRFLSEDPIGLNGGDFNLYRYVGNMVIEITDPLGLRGSTFRNIDPAEVFPSPENDPLDPFIVPPPPDRVDPNNMAPGPWPKTCDDLGDVRSGMPWDKRKQVERGTTEEEWVESGECANCEKKMCLVIWKCEKSWPWDPSPKWIEVFTGLCVCAKR